MASNDILSGLTSKIDSLVEALEVLVQQCDPLSLLDSVYWHMNVRNASINPTPDHPKEDVAWIWTMSYMHNLVAATPRTSGGSRPIREGAANACRLVGELMSSTIAFLFEWTGKPNDAHGARLQNGLSLRLLALHDWLHMRRSRFPEHRFGVSDPGTHAT